MSVLIYNGVELNYLSTQQIAYEPVYDQLAGRDYLYTKITITVSFIITPGAAPALGGESPDDTIRRVSHLLNTPRQPLLYKSGLNTLVQILNGPDANNGPLASCKISRVVGSASLICQFEVSTWVVDCGGPSGPPYVSNRFAESVEINELAMTVRVISGVLIARSDLAPNADMLRQIVVPPMEPQFLRTQSTYTLSPDGLRLSYTFRDEEQYLLPPQPAARAEGRFAIISSDAAKYYGEFELRLWGDRNTDKADLMQRAAAIGLAKLQSAGAGEFAGKNGAIIMSGSLSENLTANEVSVHLRAMVKPTGSRLTAESGTLRSAGIGLIIFIGTLFSPRGKGQTLDNTAALDTTNTLQWLQIPDIWDDKSGTRFAPGSRGTAQLLLAAAAMQDPCLRKSISALGGQLPNDSSLESGDAPADISIQATQPDDKSSLRSTDEQGIYTRYMVSQRTTLDTNTFQMPVASPQEKPAIIQTGEAVSSRRVEWSAEKIGSPPKIPDPKSTDENMILQKAQVSPQELGLAADGVSPIYRVKGVYDYIFRDPLLAFMNAALPPWISAFASALRTAPFEFSHGIIDGVNSGALMYSIGEAVGNLIGGGGSSISTLVGNGLQTRDNGQPQFSTGGGSVGAGGGSSSFTNDPGFTDR